MTIDDIPMEFTESPGGEAVVGVAVIGEPPPEKREAFYEMLLEANTQVYGTQGIALSKLPDTGEIALIGGLPFKDLEIKEFCKCLDEFVSKAEEWRETLQVPGRVRQQGRGMARDGGELPSSRRGSRRPRRGSCPVYEVRRERPRLHERLGGEGLMGMGIGNISTLAMFIVGVFVSTCAVAEPGYTNHAGNVVSGWPVKLTATHVVLAEGGSPGRLGGTPRPTANSRLPTHNSQLPTPNSQLTTYPLSIFPASEQRRIAADFGQPRVPVAVKRAITGAEKAMARSRKRAEKGLCTKEESEAFCAKSEAALKRYLDKQVKEGVITPAERKTLR